MLELCKTLSLYKLLNIPLCLDILYLYKQRKIKRFEIFRFRKTSSGRNNKLSFLIKNLYLIFWFEGRNKWGRHVKQQNLISSSKRERGTVSNNAMGIINESGEREKKKTLEWSSSTEGGDEDAFSPSSHDTETHENK